jgi:peptide/nickel transport system substrate-binding protein
VDLALDREELVRRVLHGQAAVATQLVPPAVFGYNAAITAPRPDRERARRLLAEAGHAQGLEVRLDGPNNRYVRDLEILQDVSRQLAEVGIRVTIRTRPKDEYLRYLARGDSSFYLLGWTCDTLQAGDALDGLMRSPTAGTAPNMNYQGLADPVLDGLIDRANQTASLDGRRALLGQALARVGQLHAVIPLEVQPEAVAFSEAVTWEPPPSFALRLHEMTRTRPAAAQAP